MPKSALRKTDISTYVYHTTLATFSDAQLDLLNPEDQNHAKQRKNLKRFQTFVSGRSLLAKALQKLTGSQNYQLSYNQLGKPFLEAPQGWYFNITHSDNHIFLVIQQNHEIGIDSEIIKPRNFKLLAEKIFTAEAVQSIVNADNQLTQFYKLWTRHEAQVKQLGISVFSKTPADPSNNLYSYQFENTVISLCSQRKIHNLLFFQYNAKKDSLYKKILSTL